MQTYCGFQRGHLSLYWVYTLLFQELWLTGIGKWYIAKELTISWQFISSLTCVVSQLGQQVGDVTQSHTVNTNQATTLNPVRWDLPSFFLFLSVFYMTYDGTCALKSYLWYAFIGDALSKQWWKWAQELGWYDSRLSKATCLHVSFTFLHLLQPRRVVSDNCC